MNPLLLRNFRAILPVSRPILTLQGRQYSTVTEAKIALVSGKAEDTSESDDAIEQIRNKARLSSIAYKKHHHIPPTLSEDERQTYKLARLRRIYGDYGASSNLNMGLLWPSAEEIKLMKERERVEFPDSVTQMMKNANQKLREEEERTCNRQKELSRKVAKLEEWKKEVRDRFHNQKRLAKEAKEKKERLIEEVRQVFGYRIDPKDEKFKEALEKKEQEEKRAAKAAKKLKKQQKVIAEIQKLAQEEGVKENS